MILQIGTEIRDGNTTERNAKGYSSGSLYLEPFREKHLGILKDILTKTLETYHKGDKDLADEFSSYLNILSGEFELANKSGNSRVVVADKDVIAGGGLIIPEKEKKKDLLTPRIFYVCETSSNRERAITKLIESFERRAMEEGISYVNAYAWLPEDHNFFEHANFVPVSIKIYPGSKLQVMELEKNYSIE